MSKQISFLHSEADTIAFLRTAEALNSRILQEQKAILPSEAESSVLTQMATHTCLFNLVPEDNPASGTPIEFYNSFKGNPLSRTYNVGRLYLRPTSDGEYDAATLKLFEELRKYIRRKYHYSKRSLVWFGEDFKQQYDRNYYFAISNLPIHF